MNQSLKKFRDKYLELLLTLLWQQWTSLGVSGYEKSKKDYVIDPEALLIFTCSLGRYEARLFDEALDWLETNGDFINVQRLNTMVKREEFIGKRVLSAIATLIYERDRSIKWKRLAQQEHIYHAEKEQESLFFTKEYQPMEGFGEPDPTFRRFGFVRGTIKLRGRTKLVSMFTTATFLLKLRVLFGVNARSEILLYLLSHESAHPRLIAREVYYSQKTVQDLLTEMALSGLIRVRKTEKEKHYYLDRKRWLVFLTDGTERTPEWVNWSSLLKCLEQVWLKLNDEEFLNLDSLVQASELRRLMETIRPKIEAAGFSRFISDSERYLAESYTPVFLSDLERLLKEMAG